MPRRPDPFAKNSFFDELIEVIDRQRCHEAAERQVEQDAEYEAERLEERRTQDDLLNTASYALRQMLENDTRRVRALEQIAERFDQVSKYLEQVFPAKAT